MSAARTALSPTTRDLCTRLDAVLTELNKPGCTQTENELMAAHVRSVLTGEGQPEPLFTEDVLKLAFIEIISMENKQ